MSVRKTLGPKTVGEGNETLFIRVWKCNSPDPPLADIVLFRHSLSDFSSRL